MMKKFTVILLSVIMLLSLLPISVIAEGNIIKTGKYGENVTYTLYGNGDLIISGEGATYSYSNS